MIRILFYYLLSVVYSFWLPITANCYAQNVTIKGNAPSYIGDEFIFYTYSDLITFTDKELCRCNVQNNSDFLCSFSLSNTVKTFIHLGVYKGIIFTEPNTTYEIILPDKKEKTIADKLNPYFEETEVYFGILSCETALTEKFPIDAYSEATTRVNPEPATIKGKKENELNYLIREFDDLYDDYLNDNFLIIYLKAYGSDVDTVINKIDSLFSWAENDYFNNYKKYKFAFMRHLAYQRNVKYVTKDYFLNQPVLYNNIAYMDLFVQLYDNYFSFYSKTEDGKRIFVDIAYAKSFYDLKETLNNNLALANDTFKELVILKGLHDAFYSDNFPKRAILQTLDSVRIQSTIPQHKQIAVNIKKKVTQLMKGTDAPEFELFDKNSLPVSLSQFKGKYVYLNFCTTLSFTCKQELELLNKLQEKYKEILEIITISTDEDFKKTIDYFNEHNYIWTFLHYANEPEVLKKYKIKVFPTYYLIDPDGKLIMSTAPSPDENFELYFFKILKIRN